MTYKNKFSQAPKTFYFHDYETGGLNKSLDRPVQFAGIRTDEDFNIIGEPLNIMCRIQEDYVPSLEATLVTGISPQECNDKGLSEAEFCSKILNEFSKSGTCGVGYNSIKFDDNITRNMLFRNLQDPYRREWANGNSRWDIIPLVRAAYAFFPSRFTWPKNEEGKVEFKLDRLAELNGLPVARAHDALSDVETTIALAKLLKQRVPELFDLAYSHRLKNTAIQKIDLVKKSPLFYVNTAFGVERANVSPVMPLFAHPSMGNVFLAWDLNVSPKVLLEKNAQELNKVMFFNGEYADRLPMFKIFTNQSPIMFTHAQAAELGVERLGINDGKDVVSLEEVKEVWNENFRFLRANLPEIQRVMCEVLSLSEEEFSGPDPEQKLYAGFCSDYDRSLLNNIISSHPTKMGAEVQFQNNELYQELLFRYRARNFKEHLNDNEWIEWEKRVADKLLNGGKGEARTLADLDATVTAALNNPEVKDQDIVQDMANWVDSRYNYLKSLSLPEELANKLKEQLDNRPSLNFKTSTRMTP